MKNILCYGDSNTWGFIPGSGKRYTEDIRWTGLLQRGLGHGYQVIEAGVNGRTTSFDDPFCNYLNGWKSLPYSLLSAKPVDLLIISLGTNDLKFTDARGSSKGIEAIINLALSLDTIFSGMDQGGIFNAVPKILVIFPISLHPEINTRSPPSSMASKYGESLKFRDFYQPVCEKKHVNSLDGALFATASPVDCTHMDAEGHRALGMAVLVKVKELLDHSTER